MLIPSIDLQAGRIVQLVQGDTLALETNDVDGWMSRFRKRPRIQLIDLDAAKNQGSNAALVRSICAGLPCRVGGGIRSLERAREAFDAGAKQIIVGSALYKDRRVDLGLATELAATFGPDRLIAAVDSRGGRVTIDGWTTDTGITPVEAVRALEPYFAEFLYTHVDLEGLMQGTNHDAIQSVKHATFRRLTAAGGITTMEEVDYLDSRGIDAVVGMALYTGRLMLDD